MKKLGLMHVQCFQNESMSVPNRFHYGILKLCSLSMFFFLFEYVKRFPPERDGSEFSIPIQWRENYK